MTWHEQQKKKNSKCKLVKKGKIYGYFKKSSRSNSEIEWLKCKKLSQQTSDNIEWRQEEANDPSDDEK